MGGIDDEAAAEVGVKSVSPVYMLIYISYYYYIYIYIWGDFKCL